MSLSQEKLRRLAEIEGYDSVEIMLLDFETDEPGCPGICTNRGCEFTDMVDPDTSDGWCDDCEDGTVQSCLFLAGMI